MTAGQAETTVGRSPAEQYDTVQALDMASVEAQGDCLLWADQQTGLDQPTGPTP